MHKVFFFFFDTFSNVTFHGAPLKWLWHQRCRTACDGPLRVISWGRWKLRSSYRRRWYFSYKSHCLPHYSPKGPRRSLSLAYRILCAKGDAREFLTVNAYSLLCSSLLCGPLVFPSLVFFFKASFTPARLRNSLYFLNIKSATPQSMAPIYGMGGPRNVLFTAGLGSIHWTYAFL